MEQEFVILEEYMTFTPGLNVVHVSRSLVDFVVFCPFLLFLLAIALFVSFSSFSFLLTMVLSVLL
jgi:hypothetical protein